ncbi:MAG TPA: DUF6114 domain-containing protein [Galbitalea sp.]|jgi:hypothetical protein
MTRKETASAEITTPSNATSASPTRGQRFGSWYRRRPFVGGALTILAGFELFFSGQLDLGNIHVQVGIEGLQSTVLPIAMVVLGLLAMLMPQHRIFYGVISLVLAVYTLVGLNLGGFFIGMLLGAVGGILTVSWSPKAAALEPDGPVEESAAEPPPFQSAPAAVGADSSTAAPAVAKKGTKAANPVSGGVVLMLVLALGGIGAAPVPGMKSSLCIPLLMDCSSPSPTPTPTPTSGGGSSGGGSTGGDGSGSGSAGSGLGGGLGGAIGGLLGTGGTSSNGTETGVGIPLSDVKPDAQSSTFTLPAAQMGGTSISFSGLQAVGAVTVPLIDGTRTPVLKLAADDITIQNFTLDVRASGDQSGLVTDAGTMELHGHVVAYVNSVTGTLGNGLGISLGALTPPPNNELPNQLLRVTLGLVGVTADSITFTPVHQSFE